MVGHPRNWRQILRDLCIHPRNLGVIAAELVLCRAEDGLDPLQLFNAAAVTCSVEGRDAVVKGLHWFVCVGESGVGWIN